ncbi:hypothetical protein I6N96_07455 [Enterococcus sp. BWM-S5]|uniref:Uncharacterized protein n=1 Tax=Enterococcus larvae TaxID=2794352 RepID=A0ABS4CI56_9ENTE|nr:DUF6171 family protein [Enterococcus larvae]MBP1046115.1 hypothetical protein [Enterococcus larvae]
MSCTRCDIQREVEQTDVEQLILEQLMVEPMVVSDLIRQQRISFCESCPKRSAHTCTSCGCYYKFRASLPSKSCPIGQW